MLDKLLRILDDERITAAFAAFVLAIFTFIIRQASKLPRIIENARNTKRNQQSIIDGARRDGILRDLKDTGAKFIHLVRYHNGGGALKRGTPIYMTVDIEKLGSACDNCIAHCRAYKGHAEPIIDERQKIRINGAWFNVVKKTVLNPDDVNEVRPEDLDENHRQIWEKYNIQEYHEIFVVHKHDCFYCIGLSFCSRFTAARTSGSMSIAARQMANLL